MEKQKKKPIYRIKNWHAYNQSLVTRGSLTLWLSEEVIQDWCAPPDQGNNGHPIHYSNTAIMAVLTIGKVFHLPLRALEGFVASVSAQSHLAIDIPDYSTLSRRGKRLSVCLTSRKEQGKGDAPTHIIVDSTGVKVYGEGEWKVRQHGWSKRRTWRKIHIAIDEKGEIKASEVTRNDIHDATVFPDLIKGYAPYAVAGDGAYDTQEVYDICTSQGVPTILIPPRHGAKIWQHGNTLASPHPRDENLRAIRTKGRTHWKEESGYHIRSRVEATMFRLKTIFGDRIRSREWSRQVTELKLTCVALNRMWALGMPQSYRVA